MIEKITLDKIASFKLEATLETDKKINLIYGLNGTGKSTFSKYLYNIKNDDYRNITYSKKEAHEIIVYNKEFVEDNFYQKEGDIGAIFTLSKENAEKEKEIVALENKEKELQEKKVEQKKTKDEYSSKKDNLIDNVSDEVWKIKTTYTGNGHVLDFCVPIKNAKRGLFGHINKLPLDEHTRTIEELIEEAKQLKKYDLELPLIPPLSFNGLDIESNAIFQDLILGNESSVIGSLIKYLDNSDWVKNGLGYLESTLENKCPFCQQHINKIELTQNIKSFFDRTYEEKSLNIKELLEKYNKEINTIPLIDVFTSKFYTQDRIDKFTSSYSSLTALIRTNFQIIKDKQHKMGSAFTLSKTDEAVKEINLLIDEENFKINEINKKIMDKQKANEKIKDDFWKIMRNQYNKKIQDFNDSFCQNEKQIERINGEIKEINDSICNITSNIEEKRKNLESMDSAIKGINDRLKDIGVTDFSIGKSEKGNFYKLVRGSHSENATFKTFSEGEKMLITFLYFCERCKGNLSQGTSSNANKIIVIDDPISSLSHIHIFNISVLIDNLFLKTYPYEQVFILTHSLYFFGRLLKFNKKGYDLKENVNLFRFYKDNEGSKIRVMNKDEIQSEYHEYWTIVKDSENKSPLLANCMRHILEYFFGFVEKEDINNLFMSISKNSYSIRLQGFSSYINAGSHSNPELVSDLKEFDYKDFIICFYLVFKIKGYKDHFEKMYGKDKTKELENQLPKE